MICKFQDNLFLVSLENRACTILTVEIASQVFAGIPISRHTVVIRSFHNCAFKGCISLNIFDRSVNPIPTRVQILPTLYYWHLHFFSPSGITESSIFPGLLVTLKAGNAGATAEKRLYNSDEFRLHNERSCHHSS